MKKLNIQIKNNTKNQSVFIGEGILKNIDKLFNFDNSSKVIIITDRNAAKHLLNKVRNVMPLETHFIILPPGERSKSISSLQLIWRKLSDFKSDRKTLIVNLGGGVVIDIGGFAASTYMRGLDFINIPTSLLAQVDAGIGGKTAINFLGIKNLIGTFYQPIGVVVDIETLKSLPKREFLSGFAEIIKLGLILDKRFFSLISSKHPLEFQSGELFRIITQSIKIKIDIVTQDVNEKNLRKKLNFGHTIGHAIEALSLELKKPLLHGEAVLIGMLTEAKISNLMGLLGDEEFGVIQKKVNRIDIPSFDQNINIERFTEKIQGDKKNFNGKTNWTLLKRIGHSVIDQKVEISIIKTALQKSLI